MVSQHHGQMRRNDKKSSWCLCGWAFWDLLALPGTGSQISCSIPLSRVPCKRLLTFIYLWIDIANLQSLLRKSENNYLRKLVTLYITPLPEGSWALIHEWLMSTRVDSYASLASICCAPLLFLERFLIYSTHSHHIEARRTRHYGKSADSFFSLLVARHIQQLLWYSLFFFWSKLDHSFHRIINDTRYTNFR